MIYVNKPKDKRKTIASKTARANVLDPLCYLKPLENQRCYCEHINLKGKPNIMCADEMLLSFLFESGR